MKEIYGYFIDRYSYIYLETFEDYDPETERKECCELYNDAWDYDYDLLSNNESKIFVLTYLDTEFGSCDFFRG